MILSQKTNTAKETSNQFEKIVQRFYEGFYKATYH